MLKQLIVVLSVFIASLPSFAQNIPVRDVYASEWKKVDSLLEKDLPQSARPVIEKILRKAVTGNDTPNKIKAQAYLTRVVYGDADGGLQAQIKVLDSITGRSSGIEQAIWQNLTAGMYWKFYQQNRYRLYNRTQMAQTASEDIETWDATALADRIAGLYDASLEQKALLQSTSVAQYEPIIKDGVNTRSLRPTLYDLLTFNAIAFLSNEEAGITKAADAFQMEGSLWFEPAERFSEVRVKVKDGSDFKFRTLKLYQDVIAFHLNDVAPEALIDADLQRLAFVHDKSVHPQKDSLYLKALQNIAAKFPQSPSVAQALFLIAQQQMGDQDPTPYYRGMQHKKVVRNLPQVKSLLTSIISKYPGSEGAANAQNLLNQINAPFLSLQTESVNIPDENIKALITYKQVPLVYLKLYKLPATSRKSGYENDDTVLIRIRKLQPLRIWEQALSGIADLEQHSAEIKIDTLPRGHYALVAGTGKGMHESNQIIVLSEFQVSGISFIAQEGAEKKGYVLDRKTGYPLTDAKAFFYSDNYENSKSIQLLTGNAISGKDGTLHFPLNAGNDYRKAIRSMLLVKGADSLFMEGYLNNYQHNGGDEARTQTFFFTDRAIYRPGQTILFKGIVVNSSPDNKENDVVPGHTTTVALYDANGQLKDKLELKTNEFGSFTGSFRLPEGLMNGYMYIRNEDGNQGFSVEEYKRPKFYIEFDTLNGSYALNEDVMVKGKAKAYAGNNIDNASVTYRVVRKTRFPYYWCYYYWGMPPATETEIANGALTTTADGSFEVPFRTIPDAGIDPRSMPVFYYEVSVDVTDINGETRSGTKQLVSGYNALQIVASISEASKPEDLRQLDITTQNLNGIFNPATVQVSIARLKFPGFLRKRIWSTPDQFVMSESEFHKAFPQDEFKEEGNYLNWEKDKVVFDKTWLTAKGGKLEVPAGTWEKNGWYVIEIRTRDAKGGDIVEKKYTHVWTPGKKDPVQKDIVVYSEKESYEPGEKLTIWTGTAVGKPYLLQTSPAGNKSGNPITINIQEKDRGGIALSWLYVYDNRVYTASKIIDVPWSNKELQIAWSSHRDKVQPGAQEQWTMTIKGNKKEKVAAELLAGMYDASLDAFRPHVWTWQKLFPQVYEGATWNSAWFNNLMSSRQLLYAVAKDDVSFEKRYDDLIHIGPEESYGEVYYAVDGMAGGKKVMRTAAPVARQSADAANFAPSATTSNEVISAKQPEDNAQSSDGMVQVRKNLQETAFFLPQLKTDTAGNISFSFTLPEALTEWKLMAFAHTKDWKTGYMEGKVKTQKDLMVMPNMPRFLRQGDNIQISSKIANLSDNTLNGNANIEVLDALTLEQIPLSQFMQLKWSGQEQQSRPFTAAKGQSAVVSWNLHVPESRYTPVVIRITAKAGAFSDGEDNTLPVISNRTLVTETLPISFSGNGTRNYTLNSLLDQSSPTLLPKGLTLEFTGNPAWYAVQALPYLTEYPYECAEQTFNRFYANALAQHIVAQSPKVRQIFGQWQKDSAALVSNLEKNEDLKNALLEETPWVMEAKTETEQKQRVGLLFQANRLSGEFKRTLDKLGQMQLPDGSFPWFNGMRGDRYITQYILTGIGRLHQLQVKAGGDGALAAIYAKALDYTDALSDAAYKQLLQSRADMNLQHIDALQVQYLYMRSFYNDRGKAAGKVSFEYYKKQAAKFWPAFNANLKGQIALALYRTGDTKTALQIMQSLKETAIQNKELGMYWKDVKGGYYWADAPVEGQALLIEAFSEITKDKSAVEAMKLWLLKNKQTQNWHTTKATADACYALLLSGSDWLADQPEVSIQLGSQQFASSQETKEAGTGYFKRYIEGKDVSADMGNIKVSVQQSNTAAASWGAVYWQYFEDMDKVAPGDGAVHLEKQLFIEKNSAAGPVLTAITTDSKLQVGDKVKVRIVVKTDRDMDYVQLKDMRAACFEPVDVLSAYRYQNGTGYFQSTKDLATNFFFDHLAKGTYVFEYSVWVNAKGSFSNGIATIQCMYAPEFGNHTAGMRVEVK